MAQTRHRFVDTSPAVRKIMRGNRSVDTKPELQIRSAVHRLGLRFRKDLRIDVGGPRGVRTDLAFPRLQIAVFVDGCFWHGCPVHGHVPSANRAYWSEKLAKNVQRDARNNEALKEAGWSVIRLWEHVDITDATEIIESEVRKRRDAKARGAPRKTALLAS